MSKPSETLDHEVQNLINDPALSPARRYARLVLGEGASAWQLARYELITGVLSGWPGAAGYFLRRRFYRRLFRSMGRNVTIGRHATFRGMARVSLGDNVCIDDNCVVDARGAQAAIEIGSGVFVGRNTVIRCRGEHLHIGDGTDIGCNCLIATDSRLHIGRDVVIAAYTYVAAGGAYKFDDKSRPIKEQGFIKRGGSRIGDGGWIGAYTLILDGVTIGDGAIIGAHSMVNQSIPEMAIAWGIPARAQKSR